MRRARSGQAGQRQFVLALLLLAATLLLYAPVRSFSFLSWDDNLYVTENDHTRSGLSMASAAWAFRSLDAANWHPLTWLSHLLDCSLFGMNPAGPHCVNVLLHAANVLLLFFLLYRATGCLGRSFFVAALFAFHPLNVESVAWIAERKNVLSTFFFLVAIWGYGWYVKHPNWKRYVAVAAAFAASLMSKPMAVTFPFVLLLLDYWPLQRLPDPAAPASRTPGDTRSREGKQWGRLGLEKVPFLAMSVASSWITVVAQRHGNALLPEVALRLPTRLGNALCSYFEYIRTTFWPARLGTFYPYAPLRPGRVILSASILGAVTGLVLVWRRRRCLVFGWFFFLGTLVPVIGIVQVGEQAWADRYAYLPLIGLFVVAVWLAAEISEAVHVPRAVTVGAAAVLLLAAGFATRTTLHYWKDSLTLFIRAREVASRPASTIEINLGAALCSTGRVDEGMRHYRLAESLAPWSALVHYDMGVTFMRRGNYVAALREFQTALQYSHSEYEPVVIGSLNNLGLVYYHLGQFGEAWNSYTAALNLDPHRHQSLLGRGYILFQMERYAEAAEQFRQAVAIDPSPDAWLVLAKALDAGGQAPQALAAYQQALHLNPELREARDRIAELSAQPR
jgi:tetratricopeptide (TPR) repeat protein